MLNCLTKLFNCFWFWIIVQFVVALCHLIFSFSQTILLFVYLYMDIVQNQWYFVKVNNNVHFKQNCFQIQILHCSNCYEDCSKCFVILFKLIGRMTKWFCSLFKFEKKSKEFCTFSNELWTLSKSICSLFIYKWILFKINCNLS